MGIFELFSKQQKKLRGEVPDVYQYDDFPNPFRVQVIHIMTDVLGDDGRYHDESQQAYEFIHKTLCREYGLFALTDKRAPNSDHVADFFLDLRDPERILDVIQIVMQVADNYVGQRGKIPGGKITADEAIAELNHRFKEHGLGYQFEGGRIIRMDSNVVHSEVVKPALELLQSKIYAGANDEFLKAHEHYRHRRYKECLNECLKHLKAQ